jgi:hypothetical protein
MEKPEEIICHKCGKPATGRYSPDLDITFIIYFFDLTCKVQFDLL